VKRGDVLQRYEDVAVQLDVRDILDVAVRSEHTLLVFTPEKGDLDLLAFVLVRVVLDARERSRSGLVKRVVGVLFAVKRVPRRGPCRLASPTILEVIRMWVRVARFEGGTAEGLETEMARSKEALEEFRSGGLPPGLEGVTRVLEAINRTEGTGLAIIFCDSEEDMRKADEALNNMSPPAEASGRRVSAGVYEVMHDKDLA
jgi:hypothetical protein